jgi:hypothetical protein
VKDGERKVEAKSNAITPPQNLRNQNGNFDSGSDSDSDSGEDDTWNGGYVYVLLV